ncbi:MAG: asparagine synthase (glutamine-hydrolyzing) [Butyribacter sp.]|nr:asparagine synthase (glutamine-hydrolyzing) [bacterium]MDY3855306.1 asparagine synthase (glutamine-hydrolyzing) [Butyribacter sp.]
MCGIAGFFQTQPKDYLQQREYYESILEEMKKRLIPRGPDSNGIRLTGRCGLAHTRLSVIDLKEGRQPMTYCLEGFDYTIVYNGELYNTRELRDDLKTHGWQFQTTSDTEVILLSFLHYGSDFVKKLDGIFAFAIYDERHQKIILYRDAFGVKPLFYAICGQEIIFASEIKALFCHPACKPVADWNSLREVFGIGPARIPGSGVYQGIYELEPGCYLSCSNHGFQKTVYWKLESHPHEDDYCHTIQKTRELVCSAIKRQMVSDVPVCTFLSGGVDSSLVTSVCSRELRKKGETLTTFSFDFDGNEKYFKANTFQPSQDRPYVECMTDFLHTDHRYLSCDYETQAALLKESVKAHDLPCMTDVDSSLLYFCREVSKSHKVVLTGECADEVFGGYPWFHRKEFFEKDSFPWTPDLSPRTELLQKDFAEELKLEDFVCNAYHNAVSQIETLPAENETETKRRQIGYLNIRFFMQTLLNRMDRTSMHWGLEARVPFADRALVEYIFNVPWQMKAKDGIVKNVLRQSGRGILPDEILFRKKSPYPKSYHPYYEELLGKELLQVMEDSNAPILRFIDKKKVEKFIGSVKDYGKPWYGQLMAGPQMLAYLLQINFWLEEYKIDLRI